jgi:hypothetical protein
MLAEVNLVILMAQLLSIVIIISLVTLAAIILFRLLRSSTSAALRVLKLRLAKGEISTEEYEHLSGFLLQEPKQKRDAKEENTSQQDEPEVMYEHSPQGNRPREHKRNH